MAHSKGERVTKYAYDLSGNLIRVTAPDGSVTTYRYDALNRPVRVIDALGNETTYGYDAMDRLVSARQPNGATIRLAYDPVGNLLSETDALGAKQTFAYDALGRLQEVTDALGHRTAYGYDALDNLTLVRDANGNETRYKYDSLSRLRSETDALGNTTQYEYTPEGWLKETKRPDGTTLSYDYDRTGRLLKESASDGTEIRHDFDAMGQLTEIEDENGTTKLRYDERGLLIGVENPLGDVVQYEYNQYAEKTCLIYPDGKRAEYAYDSMSRLLSVTEPNGTTTAYTYDALGRRTRTSDSTLTTEYGYDAVGNLVRQANENVTLTYRYDLNNRFAYDKAGQLTAFRRSDGYAESFVYDPVGNMVEKTLNGTKIAMTYDAANELKTMESSQGKLTYAYDLNGNLTQKTLGDRTDTYAYDARNHLKQYRGYDNYQVKYSYNALGMLHARESSGNRSRTTLEELIAGKEDSDDPDGDDGSHITTYTYDLTQPYYEVLTETTDGEVTSYTYGLERLAAYTEQTQTRYIYDGRGSVIQANGESRYYSPFGELLSEKVSGYGYNGEYYDAATGLLNLRARQYAPAVGRFEQRDLAKGTISEGLSLNPYLYVKNSPVSFADYDGNEMVVISSTPGDSDTNQYQFIDTALKKINDLIQDNPENRKEITWAVVSANYSPEDMTNFRQTAKNLGINFVEIKNKYSLINYANTKNTENDAEITQRRANDPIEYFGYFGHEQNEMLTGKHNQLSLAYDVEYREELKGVVYKTKDVFIEAFAFTQDDIGLLNPIAFNQDRLKNEIFGCNSGTRGWLSTSFAQAWANRTGGKTLCVDCGKITYRDINSYGFIGDAASSLLNKIGIKTTKQVKKEERNSIPNGRTQKKGYSDLGSLNLPTISNSVTNAERWIRIVLDKPDTLKNASPKSSFQTAIGVVYDSIKTIGKILNPSPIQNTKRVLRVTETLVKNIVQLGIDAIGKLLGGGR